MWSASNADVVAYTDVDLAAGIRALDPMAEVTEWFFDTELLIRAERAGLRIHEFSTDGVGDPDSSVDALATAWADARGILHLWRSIRRLGDGSLAIDEVPAPNTGAQILHFIDVGTVSTLLYAVLFLCGVQMLSPAVANVGAPPISTVVNTALNRRHTFGVSQPQSRSELGSELGHPR